MVCQPVVSQEDVGIAQLDHSKVHPLCMLPHCHPRFYILGDLAALVDRAIGVVHSDSDR